jgi:hypothetical protein
VEPGLDLAQPGRVLVEFLFQLGAPEREPAAQLLDRDPAEQLACLGQGEAEVLERDDPVELAELAGRIAAVAGLRIDLCWLQVSRATWPDWRAPLRMASVCAWLRTVNRLRRREPRLSSGSDIQV